MLLPCRLLQHTAWFTRHAPLSPSTLFRITEKSEITVEFYTACTYSRQKTNLSAHFHLTLTAQMVLGVEIKQ
jgi:hypothetical protein